MSGHVRRARHVGAAEGSARARAEIARKLEPILAGLRRSLDHVRAPVPPDEAAARTHHARELGQEIERLEVLRDELDRQAASIMGTKPEGLPTRRQRGSSRR